MLFRSNVPLKVLSSRLKFHHSWWWESAAVLCSLHAAVAAGGSGAGIAGDFEVGTQLRWLEETER